MRLRWTRAARQDRERIYAFIEAENAEAALQLDDRFGDSARRLIEFPYMGRNGRVAGTRELSISGSRHLLVYRIEADTIWIVRVIHTSRAWPDELP